jgi:CDP-glucose 4,6-dehydratase
MLPNSQFWSGKRVFLTGHTGFKGSWLTVWLHSLGAHVTGYALSPVTEPSMFNALELSSMCAHHIGDIRDRASLITALHQAKPDLIIHMAAQPLVRQSYREPIETFEINALGTAHLLEAARTVPSLRGCVIVTTDKCYENREWVYPYRETDALGGYDPYSASKAAAEIVTHSYRRSFFHEGACTVVSARAGNVIGGGDWSQDRLIVDAVRAFSEGREMIVRNITAVRPWQHVLEPLSGYLTLAQRIYEDGRAVSPAFNFGPPSDQVLSVGEMITAFAQAWGGDAQWRYDPPPNAPHEAGLLMLDPSLAQRELRWTPRVRFRETIALTAAWYKQFYSHKESPALSEHLLAFTRAQIREYCQLSDRANS